MKALLYTQENLETIAKEQDSSLEEVQAMYEEASRLGMEIYAVTNYVAFGPTRRPMPDVFFVSAEIIREYYNFVEPEEPRKFSKMAMRYTPNGKDTRENA